MYSLVSAGNDATALLPTVTASLPRAIAPRLACSVTLSCFVGAKGQRPLPRPEEFWLVPRRRRADDGPAWQRVHSYRESHRSIPKGLKLFGRETFVRPFEVLGE